MSEVKEGWNWLVGTPKWHYFTSTGLSLCGKWMTWSKNSDAQVGNNGSPDNCKSCARKLAALEKKRETSA